MTHEAGTTVMRYSVDFKQPRRRTVDRRAPLRPSTAKDGGGANGSPAHTRRPPVGPVATLLVIAHHVERLVNAGTFGDYTAAAAALGLLRPRLSLALRLLVLAPDLQERILLGEVTWSENQLQPVLNLVAWDEQRAALGA